MMETRVRTTTRPEPTMPNSIEIEQAVLGALLLDPTSIIVVSGLPLYSSDFYLEKHSWIYEAMGALQGRREPIDTITVSSELEKYGKFIKTDVSAYLAELMNSTPTAVNVEAHARKVVELSQRRQYIHASTEIAGKAYDGSNAIEDVTTQAQKLLSQINTSRRSKFETTNEIGERVAKRQAYLFDNPDMPHGLQTGYRALNNSLCGLEPKDLIVVAGRPGSGKTSLLLGIAANVASKGKRVAVFTLEMSNEACVQRLVAMRGGFDLFEIRKRKRAIPGGWRNWTEEEQSDYFYAITQAQALPISWNDASAIKTRDALAQALELEARDGLDLVVFDYLGLAGDESSRKRYEQVGVISRGLKEMAKTLGVPVLAGAQLNRECDDRKDKKPMLSDLRDSGDIEQDVDVGLLIWRPKMYWPTEEDWREVFKKDKYPEDEVEIAIAKQRNGPTGFASMVYDASRVRFMDIERSSV